MRSLPILLVAGCALFAAALASQQPAATDSAWQAFQQQAGGSWVSEWHPATGTPAAIYGTGLRLANRTSSEADARTQGAAVLARWAALLGLGASDFQVAIAGKMGGTWALVYDQSFRGVPVIGGRADVRIHESGVLSLLGSIAFPIPAAFGTVPVVNATTAEFIAWKNLGVARPATGQPGKQGTRLCIWGDLQSTVRAPFFLAWEVGVSAVDQEGNGPVGRYYVDALTGNVLHYHSDKHECGFPGCSHHGHGGHDDGHDDVALPPPVLDISGTVTAWTRTGLNAVDPLVNIPLAGLEVVVPGVGTAITDATGTFSIPSSLTSPVSVTVNMNGIHCQLISGGSAPTATQSLTPGTPGSFQLLTSSATAAAAAHTGTYYWVYKANEWIRTILGNTSQMATADNVHPTVNIASTCNAYYTNNTINFYAAGGSCNNTGFSTVVAHEWGHGIDDRYGGISNNTGDGLSEAWGDTIAMYVADDPEIGRGFNVGATTGIRTGLNTRQWPTIGGLEVHSAGESYMGFCWQVRNRLRTTLGIGPGTTLAEQIVIGSIIANATNQTNAVREIFIADDNDGNLINGTPHYDDLVYACNTHSMPYPVRQLGAITHTPLPSTNVQLTPRVVLADVTAISGSITQARLHYDLGGGPQVRVMTPTGQPNGYEALLPGIVSPGNVFYHLEATHSTSAILRLPATGEWQTSTVSLTPLDAQLRIAPDQVPVGSPLTLSIAGRPTTPFLLALGDTAGPTVIPGIPPMQVGGNYVTLPAWTDGAGNFALGFNAPASASAIGTFWYSQALTLNAGGSFVTSNAWFNLFTN